MVKQIQLSEYDNMHQRLYSQKNAYLARLGVFCEDLGDNWRRYNGTALY